MRTLKNVLFLTLVLLLAASVVIVLLWGISKSGLADRMRKTSGRDITSTTTDVVSSGTAPTSPQDSIRAIASFVKVSILAFLKVTVLLGIPGVLTAIAVYRMKRHQRQQGEA